MEVVTASGDVRTFCTDTDDPTVMDAARLHLGLFGIIYRLTLDVVPTFRVHQLDCRLPMKGTICRIREVVTKHDYLDLYWWPFTDMIWVKALDRTTAPRTARPRRSIRSAVVSRLEIEGSRLAYEWLRGVPEATPKTCPRIFTFTASRRDCVVDIVDGVHYQKWIERMKVECIEFAFPVDPEFARVQRAWIAVVETMRDFARHGQYPFNLTLNARFIKGSRALLSPAVGAEHTCYIEILSYYKTPGWREFAAAVAREWMKLPGAKPHWAKDFAFIPDIIPFIRRAYGQNLASFLRIREELEVDPDRMFVNDLMHDLFFRA
jgi:L-gulonolactone oxidase